MCRESESDSKGVVDVIPGRQFALKIANWPAKPMKLPKRMVVAPFKTLPNSMLSLSRDPVATVQLYKMPETKEARLERHYDVAKEDALKKTTHWMEQLQVNRRYAK